MIIQILQDGVVIDTVHETAPSSPNKSTITRVLRTGTPNVATPAAGAHAYAFQIKLEAGEIAAVPQFTGKIVVERVRGP